jgi:hypothetical protein
MNKRLIFFTLLLVVPLHGTPSFSEAWEFTIDSALLNFRYVYASQAGPQGFFGPFNVDMSSHGVGDLAPLNGWFQRKMISGTTAMNSSTRFSIFTSLKLNKAVTILGTYRINSDIRNNLASIQNPDLENVISYGRWTRLWITVNTPLGNIYYGRRGFLQGCGLQFSSAETAEDIFESGRRAVEIFQLESFWGPFTIGAGFYPWRLGGHDYWNMDDQNAARSAHLLGYIKYAAGPVETGAGGFYFTFHEGPEALKTVSERRSYPPRSTTASEGWIYLKYNNGRLFFNTEADWYYRTISYEAAMDGSLPGPDYSMSPVAGDGQYLPPYTESWRYMTEFGGYSGPFKLTFLLAHMPGPDRRHGILIDKQPYIQDPARSAYGVFYPYGILMGKYYRAGVDSFFDMSASNVAAFRFDYMIASNLNILASVMKANRSSTGYSWGYVAPDTDPLNFGSLNFNNRGSFISPVPSIPDNDLGWEFNVGIAWKLLENWRISGRGAYWQPGKWFNYACVDKSTPYWDAPNSGNNFGTNPNRTIAPILGVEIYIDARL